MVAPPRKIAILQPNYIPWKGVFDLISRVDVFVFYDDVQYTIKDWRNRNKIKTPNGELWLSVPVIHKGKSQQLICDAEINNSTPWQKNHYKSLKLSYSKSKFFKEYEFILEALYLNQSWDSIAELDIFATKLIADSLGLNVEWQRSSTLNYKGSKTGDKVIQICRHFECDHFINGPSSRIFMDEKLFHEAEITLEYIDYNYDAYQQPHPPFSHYVSALDVLFNCGPEAINMICKGKT